jgi:curved DNA-binding protein CbpA
VTYYQILNIPQGATQLEIKAVYRKLAFQHHPDRGGDRDQFSVIQKAYEALDDPKRRREYDESLKRRPVKNLRELATSLAQEACSL